MDCAYSSVWPSEILWVFLFFLLPTEMATELELPTLMTPTYLLRQRFRR
jgi:hypothetical protein